MTEIQRAGVSEPFLARAAEPDVNARRHLVGHAAVFDVWTEVDNWLEGHFMERVSRGAFKRTLNNNLKQVRCLYEHGWDMTIERKPLGPIVSLVEDDIGLAYDVALSDTDYNRGFIVPTAEDGLLGASFRAEMVKAIVDNEPGVSDHNPDGLPEHTLTELRLIEFGPCSVGCYETATAGLRSAAEHHLWHSLDEAGRQDLLAMLTRTRTPANPGPATPPPTDPPPALGVTERRARAALLLQERTR